MDVSSLLKRWLMSYIDQDIKEDDGSLIGLKRALDMRPRGGQLICLANIGGYSIDNVMLLIKAAFGARNTLLAYHTFIPALGYPMLLYVMFAHLHVSSSNR